MRFISAVLLSSVFCLLASCATRANYSKAVYSWSGANNKTLFRVWGYPNKTQKMANGHRLYVYKSIDRGRYPLVTTPGSTTISTSHHQTTVISTPPTVSGGGSYDFRCYTWFEVNRHDVIVNSSFRGNNCNATANFIGQYGNPAVVNRPQ